uniref:CX domain-containing protein n=1 Tax=Plectus sambesii TaxID=2011161 RepID=A0A914WKN2_9BILA
MNATYNVVLLLLLLISSTVEVSARGGRGGGGRGGSLGGSRVGNGNGGHSGGTKSRSRLPSSLSSITAGGGATGGFLGGMRLWSFKTTSSIAQRPSSRFQAYITGAVVGNLISRPSRTFYYSNDPYYIEPSDNVCKAVVAPHEIRNFNQSLQGDTNMVPVYFLCDGKCCELDCCELNTGFVLFIIGCGFFTVGGVCLCCYCDNMKQPSAQDKEWFKGRSGELATLPGMARNSIVASRFANRQSICSTIFLPNPDLPLTSPSAAQRLSLGHKELSDAMKSKPKLKTTVEELEESYMT